MTHREVLEALSGILLGMFVSILATSVVSTSLPRIITDLGGSQSAFTWVVTATLLTTTVSTPIWGKLADLVDRKLLIQLALAVSVISSALAGLAHSTELLIGMRALQGIGAGGLTALGTVLIADIISPRERGRYMGLMGAVMAVGMVGGPLLGGVITDAAGWRWNFFVGLPFAVAAIIVLQRTLHLPAVVRRRVRIDWAGAVLLSASIATLLLWITFAGSSFAWMSWQTAVMVGGSALGVVAVVAVESRAAEPMIPLHLFRNRTVVLTVIASVAVGIALFGTQVFLSQYMQLARGKTPTESGLLTIPMVVGTFLASTLSGRAISRSGRYKKIMVVGAVLLTAGLGLMGTIDEGTSFTLVGLYMLVVGAGVGMLMQNLVLATQNTLPITDMGAGTATVAFFRTLGGAIGVSALGAVLSNRVSHLMVDGLTGIGVPPSALGSGGSTSLPDLATLPGPVRQVVEHAFGVGVAELFLIGAPIALLALVAVLALREVPLGRASGLEQRLAAEAEAARGEQAGTTPAS
ncbi:MFS transporter [Cellulomonas dongxiuzhuiae]|uniref:MFS transporter n=2 Tax=Cellulomonas dongxiuzhuiae TaxID=2819979 RepID=A0ABX8GQC2_9CELL|nr:MFS transporter [Cellulomonas dongxiuzhuiae]MBO3088305.1 MFS transporter [Cellulomonas dongxiuzhuiae]MBO3094363.1 MFS transporter [Cellulomonas dongxiuzhuiae]QWC17956.1 MFS transporter [Cellulomonas dongxiuzhuiae]